jgi:hypothetical protein
MNLKVKSVDKFSGGHTPYPSQEGKIILWYVNGRIRVKDIDFDFDENKVN